MDETICRSDAYILLPGYVTELNATQFITQAAPPETNKYFIDTLISVSQYECIGDFSNQFERHWLGDFSFACCDDDYESCFPEILASDRILKTIPCSIYLTYNKSTRLCVVWIAIPNLSYDLSHIADQISSVYIYISDNRTAEFTYLYAFLEKRFHIIHLDVPRVIFALDRKPEPPQRMQSILAGNAYMSEHVDYHVKSLKINADSINNIAEYDFYEAYVSSNVLLYILKDFSDDYQQNIENETALLFICELIMFQNGAIDRVNKKVVAELSLPRRLKLRSIENLEVEFGKSIVFWNKKIFKYPLVQNLSNNILNAFGTYELLETYTRNQKHLEHIVELRASQSAEKEGKVLNIIAILLALIQIIPILIEYFGKLPSESLFPKLFPIHTYVLLITLTALIYLVNHKRKRSLKKLKK